MGYFRQRQEKRVIAFQAQMQSSSQACLFHLGLHGNVAQERTGTLISIVRSTFPWKAENKLEIQIKGKKGHDRK